MSTITPEQFFLAAKYFALGTLLFGLLTAIAFAFKWGLRFRLVGATGFMGVLTAGLFGLSFEPLVQTVVPGSVPYATVFDSGAAQVVIAVPNAITETELEATLQQAAINLLKPSRLSGRGQQTPTIRARAIVHRPGVSELVYVGQVTPGTGSTPEGTAPVVTIYRERLAKANQAVA